MDKKYNVNAEISIHIDVICQFEDDGKTDLEEQAREAALEYAEIPLSLLQETEIDRIVFEEDFNDSIEA